MGRRIHSDSNLIVKTVHYYDRVGFKGGGGIRTYSRTFALISGRNSELKEKNFHSLMSRLD